jgi:hypothetical protein
MRRHLILLTFIALGAATVLAQNTVKADQGRPGNQGPWPVTCVSGCGGSGGGTATTIVSVDGGFLKTGYRPEPQTLQYIPTPFRGEAAGTAGRVGHHVATGGVAVAEDDAGYGVYLPIPLARHNTNAFRQEFNGTVVGVRMAGAQGDIDLILPVFIDGTTVTPGHGVVGAGRNYQDNGSGDITARIQRMGVSGATVMDNHCFAPDNSAVSVSGVAVAVPAAALTDRRFAQICNDPRNVSSAYLACSETTTPTLVVSDPNDVIYPGDCLTYWVGSGIGINCISNAASTVAQVKQCY